jgi:phytanoyl-CoA hydroxylase
MFDEQAEQYSQEGYTIFRSVLDATLMADVRAHHQWAIENSGWDCEPEHFRVRDVFIARLASDPRLVDIAEAFIGPDIGLFGCGLWYKPARAGLPVLWHQDIEYWPLDPPEVVTLWLSVTESNQLNGCMEVIPRSHGELLTHHIQVGRDHAFFDGARVVDISKDDEQRSIKLELKCGDVSLHHPQVIHGSKANTSETPRFGISINYVPAHVTIKGETREWNWLLRGEDRGAGHKWQPFPKYRPGEDFPFQGCEDWA